MIIDFHCHLHEYSLEYIERLLNHNPKLVVVAVSDDYESSSKTIDLARRFKGRIVPCIGLHPWEVGRRKDPVKEVEAIIKLAEKESVPCFGEIGLDTKFVAETIDVQRTVFRMFIEEASRKHLLLNLHAAGTWEEVVNIIAETGKPLPFNVHWYTGPLHLITRIRNLRGYISINPAVKIQKKHQDVVRYAPLDVMLTESDGPYEYRGLKLGPELIPETIRLIAEIKGVEEEAVKEAVKANFQTLIKRVGIDVQGI